MNRSTWTIGTPARCECTLQGVLRMWPAVWPKELPNGTRIAKAPAIVCTLSITVKKKSNGHTYSTGLWSTKIQQEVDATTHTYKFGALGKTFEAKTSEPIR